MPSPRILHYASAILHTASASASASGTPPESLALDTDLIIILTALLCALFCVVALALVARCTSLRPSPAAAAASIASALLSRPPASRGLKKRILRSLPTLSFDSSAAGIGGRMRADLCAICLAEFGYGERVRFLPQCGHGFHASCVDKWLSTCASCPSCRILVSI